MGFILATKCRGCGAEIKIVYDTFQEHQEAARGVHFCDNCKAMMRGLWYGHGMSPTDPDYDPDCEETVQKIPKDPSVNPNGTLKPHGYKKDGGPEFL